MHKLTILIIGLVALMLSTITSAQNSTKKAQELAYTAMKDSNWTEAIEYFHQAIDQEPNNYKLHYDYIALSMRIASESVNSELEGKEFINARNKAAKDERLRLTEVYNALVEKEPNNAAYHATLGALHSNVNWKKAQHHFLETLRLDPKIPVSYDSLALFEDTRGNVAGNFDYLKRGSEAHPDDPNAAFMYTYAFKSHLGYEAFKKAVYQYIKKFPNHDRAAQALFWLADSTKDKKEKINILNNLRESYSFKEYRWAAAGMSSLFSTYATQDPQKAFEIADEMVKSTKDAKNTYVSAKRWSKYYDYQANIIKAKHFIETGKPEQAIKLLDGMKTPRQMSDDLYNLLFAKALSKLGKGREAYEFLLKISAFKPTEAVQSELNVYAAKLSLSPKEVTAQITATLEKQATSIEDFSFERIDTNKKVSLSDYHGKVVLLNFWYPTCGPCRGENPTIQKVLAKYQDRGFEVLALNVKAHEENFVMPYMKGMGFDFVPLRSTMKFAEDEFQARGYPTNILIDTKGRKIMRLPAIHNETQRTLELQIEALLP